MLLPYLQRILTPLKACIELVEMGIKGGDIISCPADKTYIGKVSNGFDFLGVQIAIILKLVGRSLEISQRRKCSNWLGGKEGV